MLLVYRKYYGTRLTLRLLAWFWIVMAAAGVAVEGRFSAARLIPHNRAHAIVATGFRWIYMTFLNLVFLAIAASLYWLYRNRIRLGGGFGYATDPVCGMQVRTADAPASLVRGGHAYWFSRPLRRTIR